MSEEWKQMNDAQKQQYQQESDSAREEYKKKMVEFKAKQAKAAEAEAKAAPAGGDQLVGTQETSISCPSKGRQGWQGLSQERQSSRRQKERRQVSW